MRRFAYLVLLVMISLLTACSSQTQEQPTEPPAQTEPQMPAESPSMNVEEIAEGNFESVAGIWVSASGERLVFQNDGLATTNYVPDPPVRTYYGTANMVVNREAQDLREGFVLEFIPAGVTIGEEIDYSGNVLFTDSSDSNRDRLWAGSGVTPYQEQGDFYYRLQ